MEGPNGDTLLKPDITILVNNVAYQVTTEYKFNLGAAGYVYEKLSPDSGSGTSPLVADNIDRSYGIGPEFKYTDPVKHLGLDFRYERQFGVEAKT